MRALDADARATRKKYEDTIEAPMRSLGEKVSQATFAVLGPTMPPDATFTLRLSVGVVKGYPMNGRRPSSRRRSAAFSIVVRPRQQAAVPPCARASERKARIDMSTPFDFVTANDIIGGNSGPGRQSERRGGRSDLRRQYRDR